jgi:hypothetical protein
MIEIGTRRAPSQPVTGADAATLCSAASLVWSAPMKPTTQFAALTLAMLASVATVQAESVSGAASSAGSSASSAGSASLGSISDSFRGSSDSSTGQTKVADGHYRVMQVAEVAERPGMLRLTLRAAEGPDAGRGEFTLDLPGPALAARPLATGDRVHARQRPYGIEFAHAADAARAREPFFLVLADPWLREIEARAVKL